LPPDALAFCLLSAWSMASNDTPGDVPRDGVSQATVFDDTDAPEARERASAIRRGRGRERQRAEAADTRAPYAGIAPGSVAARAFAALADNVRDYAIFLMDPDGIITFWGEGARLIKWWTKDEAEGAHLRLLYPAGGSEDGTAEGHLRQAAERGEYTGEGQRVRSDGSTFWAGITLTALWDDSGTLLGFAKVTRDLTARRAADGLLQSAAEAAEMARAAAESANIAKSGFLATMSHEIRTPINAILGYLELLDLEIGGILTVDQRSHVTGATSSARHLVELVNDVLDFSRIEAARATVERSALQIGDAISAALELVAPQASARDLDLVNDVGGYAAGLAAWGDDARVRQILVNLLGNAVKFTASRGGKRGRVAVSAGAASQPSPGTQLTGEGPWIYVRVEDTGPGIHAHQLENIFEPFVQADMALTRTYGGTGLGLAISRRLARLMNGDVTATSEVGVGSTFFLWLPAAPVKSLETGGVQGHGPNAEATESDRSGQDRETLATEQSKVMPPAGPSARAGRPLRALADALMADIGRILHGYVARLRNDPHAPSAKSTDEAQLEDHLASFLADVATTIRSLDEVVQSSTGEPVAAALDGSDIQRVVAERHGAQRARLGWAHEEVRREFTILAEEMSAAVRRRAPSFLYAPTVEARRSEAESSLELLKQFLTVAERLSLASHARAAAELAGRGRSDAPV
jgi:PAS domain S-box-containing protein